MKLTNKERIMNTNDLWTDTEEDGGRARKRPQELGTFERLRHQTFFRRKPAAGLNGMYRRHHKRTASTVTELDRVGQQHFGT